MGKILLIKAFLSNNTTKGSISCCAAEKFLEYYKKDKSIELIEKDLNDEINSTKILTEKNLATYYDHYTDELIDQLKQVDKIIIATAMYNFNYPSILKNYIDCIMQAKKTFIYKYEKGKGSSQGLIPGKKVQIIIAQGAPIGWYPFADIATNLKGSFEFIGMEINQPIIIDGVKTPEMINLPKEEIIAKFNSQILNAVKTF